MHPLRFLILHIMQFILYYAICDAATHLTGCPMTTETGGLQSLDGALHLLKILAAQEQATGLTELARAAEMPVSKAHRYMASFIDAGRATQTRQQCSAAANAA